MTKNEAVKKLVDYAKSQVGYAPTSGKRNKFAEKLDALGNFYNGPKNGYDWCDVFADCCFVECFGAEIGRNMVYQPTYSAGAGCLYSANYYKVHKAWYGVPQVGDQIFYGYNGGDHTGIVVGVTPDSVTTVEGNWGNAVVTRTLQKSDYRIAGYGRPNWALVSAAEDIPAPVPEQKETAKPVADQTYTVKAGDTMWDIANKYGTTVSKLAEYNQIGNPSLIFVGQKIRIPGTKAAAKASISVGDTVFLQKGATTYTGASLASFVYNRKHKVVEVSGNRAVIAYQGTVVAAVKVEDLVKTD